MYQNDKAVDMRKKFSTKLLSRLSRTRLQLTISILVSLGAGIISYFANPYAPISELQNPSQAVSVIGVIGTILAVASSASFGYLLYYMSDTNNRKAEAYRRLQDDLNDLDAFLRSSSRKLPLIIKAQSIVSELRALRLSDYSALRNTDWEDYLEPILGELKGEEGPESLRALENELLIRLADCEDAMGEISIMSIKQIIAQVHSRAVIKSFMLLAVLMISAVALYYLPNTREMRVFISTVPIFFATFSSLIFVEVSWTLHREADELLDFVERDDQVDVVDEVIVNRSETSSVSP